MSEVAFVFLAGIIAGSFLNVCIFRMPEKISVVSPGSFCPKCNTPILWWNNIPLLGFILLRGKCRSCHAPISYQYPLVELLAGLLTVLTFSHFGFSIKFLAYTNFIYFLIVIAFIDARTQLIYNKVLIFFLGSGILLQVISPFIPWQDALLGMVTGGAAMFLIALLGQLLFKKESLGMGDVKLALVAGFFVGWKSILIALYIGFVLAFLSMIFINRINKNKISGSIPLAPFLAGGLIVFLFWGTQITRIYWSLVI